MSILPSMASGIPGAATRSATPVQTQADDSNANPLDVADEVGKITNQNSLAMRSARAKGNEVAASRGLQNSSVGAEAAQRAMVDAALPMAQQNVSQRFNADQSDKNREHEKTMQEDSVRANTVGEYLNTMRELQKGFLEAYKDIQSAELPEDQKQRAIADLYNKQQQQINQMKQMFGSLGTTEKDWSDFQDLLN